MLLRAEKKLFLLLSVIGFFMIFYPSHYSNCQSVHQDASTSSARQAGASAANNTRVKNQRSPPIAVAVKTGATEVFEKVPIQLLTFLQLVDEPMIFSDMEQEIGAYHVFDALDQVYSSTKEGNEDFDIYRLQQTLKHNGIGVQKTLLDTKPDAAWNLDKYKNIHMAKKVYQMRPDAQWYIFIDADTYLVVSSLLGWLKQLDPAKPLYMGSIWLHGETPFAQGGSGYVLSSKLMEKLLGKDPGIPHRFDEKAKDICCGDVNLALAIYENHTSEVLGVGPMIYSDTIATLQFGPQLWCQPVITMHHVSPTDINRLWLFEQSRPDPSQPVLFKEIYDHFVKPYLQHHRSAWNNYAKDAEFYGSAEDKSEWTEAQHQSWWSYENCQTACKEERSCMMYAYNKKEQKCSFSWSVAAGMCQSPDTPERERIESGWMVDRIEQLTRSLGSCKDPNWVGL